MNSIKINEYNFLPVEKVIYGKGSLNQLSYEVKRLNVENIVFICSNSLINSSYVNQIKNLLGERLKLVLAGTKQHVLSQSVFKIASKIKNKKVDLLISMGGGTVIDTTKAVALVLGESLTNPTDLAAYSVKYEHGKETVIPFLKNLTVPHIAIPTTLSAAEFSNIIGITDEKNNIKELYIDNKLTPQIVILDPYITLKTPSWLWLSTGIKALDHAIETVYSKQQNPLTTSMALEAIRKLNKYLPKTKENPNDENSRLECQIAAWMSFFGVTNVMMGLSHGIGHQLGARTKVAHGITSCIMLPHVMRFLVEETIEEQAKIAEAMDSNLKEDNVKNKAKQASELVEELIKKLELPSTLREVSISKDYFYDIANDVMQDLVVENCPRKIKKKETIIDLLEMAW